MIIFKKKAFWGIFLTTFFCIFAFKAAHALTLIPPSLEVNLTPGVAYKTSVKLFNEEEKQIVLYPSTANFTAKDETGTPGFNFNEPVEGLSSWIQVDAGPYTIKPGERIEVPISINTPTDAEPGGHYSALFFAENPPDKAQIAIGSKLGVLILGRVAGNVVEQGSISSFTVENTEMLTRLPINFAIRYQNTGNVHLRPVGSIEIKDMFGKVKATLDVNTVKGATLPSSIRKYEATWDKSQLTQVSGSAWSKFWQEYRNERANYALGKYTATASLTAGETSKATSTNAITFWVWPWHLSGIAWCCSTRTWAWRTSMSYWESKRS